MALSYFGQVQNYLEIEGNLEITTLSQSLFKTKDNRTMFPLVG